MLRQVDVLVGQGKRRIDAIREIGVVEQSVLFEEFLVAEHAAGRLELVFKEADQDEGQTKALLHGHCHQKAFGVMGSLKAVLELVPGLDVEVIESVCCGMAGAFGYQAETYDISMKMAEASLLPAVRKAGAGTIIVANGTSCRCQIRGGAGRDAVHAARVLERALVAP
jgi:Fe-S oxidoreductase